MLGSWVLGIMPIGRGGKFGFLRRLVGPAVVLALGGLTAACFQPLYGSHSFSGDSTVLEKLSTVAVEVANAPPGNGTPQARLAVGLRNALLYKFNGGEAPTSPTHRLEVTLTSSITTVIVDVASGRPATQVEAVNVSFALIELATKKVVLRSTTFGRASFDIPGTAQRFAQQRAWHNAEDRAVTLVSENITNRLASFFVAGT